MLISSGPVLGNKDKSHLNFNQMKHHLGNENVKEHKPEEKDKTKSNTEVFQDLLLRSLKN